MGGLGRLAPRSQPSSRHNSEPRPNRVLGAFARKQKSAAQRTPEPVPLPFLFHRRPSAVTGVLAEPAVDRRKPLLRKELAKNVLQGIYLVHG